MSRLAISLFLALLAVTACSGSVDDVASTTASIEEPDVSPGEDPDGTEPLIATDEDADVDGSEPLEEGGEDEPVTDVSGDTTTTTVDGSTETTFGTTTTLAVVAGNGVSEAMAADLGAALEVTQDVRFQYPYFYAEVTQSCEGCVPIAQLYFSPDSNNPSRRVLAKVFVNGAEASLTDVAPSLRTSDPIFVPEVLLAAAPTNEITYQIDPLTGLATSWTIGSEQVTISCLEGDTRPLDHPRSVACGGTIIR